ncbi:MAG: DUF4160 domain-containing protein [Bdellovibrionota bacterium]
MSPQVQSVALEGVYLFFNSDDHLPPHFHAERLGEWECRVMFLRRPEEMIEGIYGNPSGKERRELLALAEANRAALLKEWGEKVLVKSPGPAR